MAARNEEADFDVVVVGAGFAGLYALHRLRTMGFSTKVLEAADDVGGTWYWNRYPGARCDIETVDYTYTWDPDLEHEWTWSERYATQPEILRYLQFVTEKHDLRKDIQFSTRVVQANWDDGAKLWRLSTDGGETISCQYYVMATGCLSMPKTPDVTGHERFQGEVYYTSRWPHEGVDLTGKRVGVIGTGSSGVQSIPIMAKQASQLTVFQRTPNFSIPAHNGPVVPERLERLAKERDQYRHEARWSRGGVPIPPSEVMALSVSEEERQAAYDEVWRKGELISILGVYGDLLANEAANDTLAEYIRNKIRTIVKDPETAEALCPKDHPFGTKRPCLDTGYYETFNLPHVQLVDLRKDPITTVTETGIQTASRTFDFDVIVYATGFDAMTGAIVGVDITGKHGTSLKQKWADGPKTYLGLMITEFPNFFTVTGPGSPSVLSNMAVSIEQHVDWISDTIGHMRDEHLEVIEPTPAAEAGWVQHVNDFGDITLYPKANSWYMGANVPGKPRVFLPYVGGVDRYRSICDEVVARDYLGFSFETEDGATVTHDGVVRTIMPDIEVMLEMMAGLGLPPIETMSPADARAFVESLNAVRPPGPDVGEVVDGTLPGAAGDLNYRLYRPATEGPHPVVVYFHGGGWVFGSHDSDDPLCRDLCVQSNSIIISVDYRHAPEARFPAAPDDGFAAVQWVAANAESLGGVPGQLAVAGWSAGGNVAAVVSQMARDAGGPTLVGQLLLTPVTDSDMTRQSYVDNADGYVLTTPLMEWFWNHYADPSDRTDPKAAPLRAADLSGLPPAVVITCDFDPLRDEGTAYAEALAAAGVPTKHIRARGHTHTSLTMVDVIVTGADTRADMAAALREFFGASVPA
jgi:cation diffusion facilitator CzcD-associated flavoprotein CzcO/acetyl esterase/lipase